MNRFFCIGMGLFVSYRHDVKTPGCLRTELLSSSLRRSSLHVSLP